MRKIFTFFCAALMSVGMWADPNIVTPTISGDLSFTESTTVTMTCPSPNADIYYTTDGVTDPKCDCAAAPEYKQPITITETTIIKAAAYDGNDWSAVAEVTFTKVPASDPATTVTWNSSTLSSIHIYDDESFTQDGVTVTSLNGVIDGDWQGGSSDASFKFSTSLGNFTKIEITGTIYMLGGSGWTLTSPGAVWTGEANETTFGQNFDNVSQIVFTIEEPAPAEPLFDLRYENKWLRVTPKELGVNYFVFIEDKEYYDNRYQQYDQTTMQNYLDYVVGVVVGMSAQSSFEYNGDLNLNPDPIYHTWYDNDHLLINHDYVAFVFKFENDARVGDVEYLAFTYAGEPEQEEGIENIVLTEKAKKVVVDGMVYIVRDGKMFDLTGAEVK